MSAEQGIALSILRKNSKSFALAQTLLPRESRDDAAILYAWCRRADDAVDNVGQERAALALIELERELDSIYAGERQADPLLEAFRQVVDNKRIPKQYPAELLLGMRMDVEGVRYQSLSELLLYCYRVAGTVGLMMCHAMGVSEPKALKHAAHLGIAMQLTNICRDVAEDYQRGRLYLPSALLGEMGKGPDLFPTPGAVLPPERRPAFARAVSRLLREADSFYASGDAGLVYLGWRAAWAIATARLVYARIGAVLRAWGHDVTRGRAVVPHWLKLWLAFRGLLLLSFGLPRRVLARRAAQAPLPALRYPADVLHG